MGKYTFAAGGNNFFQHRIIVFPVYDTHRCSSAEHRQSVFAPFFGVTASTLTATGKLARLGNAKVLGLFHYRDPDTHQYRIVFREIDARFPTGDEVTDATLVNAMIEDAVREEPAQYMWVHRRFKTRPPGEASVY